MEYFVVSHSFAAPFFSDTDESYIEGESPAKALLAFVKSYKHPAGLYAANIYADADAFHKGKEELAQWLCNHELAKRNATKDKGGYSYLGHEPGRFEINGVEHQVLSPKDGRLVSEDKGKNGRT